MAIPNHCRSRWVGTGRMELMGFGRLDSSSRSTRRLEWRSLGWTRQWLEQQGSMGWIKLPVVNMDWWLGPILVMDWHMERLQHHHRQPHPCDRHYDC